MRLIDADKLELKHFVQRVTEQPISYEGTQPIYANYDIIAYDVDNAPTVKAIPIEWIEKQIKMTTDITNEKELDVLYAGNLSYMLKLWEKENENN